MTAPLQLKQLYKNRAEAYRLFIQAQGLPVGQTKFYNDAERLQIINQDKTIELASLLAYVKNELQIDPASGQSLVEKENEKKSAEFDLRMKELKVASLEREQRKDDRDWVHRDTVHEREGAIVGRIMEEIRYQLGRSAPALITICRGDATRRNEVAKQLDETVFAAFRVILDAGEVDITYEEETDESATH